MQNMPGIESFRRRDKDSPSHWAAKLEGANFQWAREIIAGMFETAEEEAQRDGRYVCKAEFFHALRPFLANPCVETAVALLNAEERLWNIFEQSKHPLIAPKISPAERTRAHIQNGQSIPLIECGVSSIKLGVFTRLSRKFRQAYDLERAIPLAFCVTQTILCEPIQQPTFQAFAESTSDLIEREIRDVFTEPELADAVLLAYAARMIALGWERCDPFNPVATQFTERATDNNVEIPNIVQMWGAKAITTFFQSAQEFMAAEIS
jgi:hypothetical protein